MFEKPDLIKSPEVKLDQSDNTEMDVGPKAMEQRVNVIEIDDMPSDIIDAVNTLREKKDGPDGYEKFKKGYDYGISLKEKYGGNKMQTCYLYHLIIGSTIDPDHPVIKMYDLEGEDSIAKFIEEL